MADVLPLGDFSAGLPSGISPEQLAALMQVLGAQTQAPASGAPAQPGRPLLADALPNVPSMLGNQMPAPEMPQVTGPANSVSAPDASPLARMPTLLGLQPPQMPPNGNNGRPAGIPPTATPANAAAGKPPDEGDGEDTPPNAGLSAPRAPTAYTGLPGAKPVAAPNAVPGAPTPSVSAPPSAPVTAAAPGSTAAPGAPSRPADASPAVAEPSIWRRLGDAGIGDTLLAIGGGLLSGKNFAEGLGAGFQGAARAGQLTAATNLANAKAQAEQQKLVREQQVQNQTAAIIARRMGISVDDATALAANPNFVQGFLTSQYGAQAGRVRNADGSMAVIPGSEQDPAQILAATSAAREPIAEAAARAGAVTKATNDATPDEPYTMTPGQVRFDPNTNQPVASLPAKTDETASQKEYAAAKADGFTGSFLDFMDRKGNATRAQTTINNAVNPVLKGLGDQFVSSAEEARAAANTVRAVQSARSQMDAPGGIFTGTGAEQQLALQKIGSFLGVADPRAIQNTETFRTQIKPIVLETVKGLGSGSGISNADRDFALQAVGGDIKLDEGTIRRVLDITERANREKIDRHNSLASQMLDQQPELKQVGPMMRVGVPDVQQTNPAPGIGAGSATAPQPDTPPQGIMQFRTQTEYAAAPRGTRYIAPDGKLRVKQ